MKKPINKFSTELARKKPSNLILLSVGNPSPKFDATRHSAGHAAIDYIANNLGGLADESHRDSAVSMSALREHPNIYLARSQEYMNLSGKAVRAALKRFPQNSFELVIVHDDVDTECGECKFKLESRQVGGHGGLKDIVRMYPDAFARLRVGIGRPPGRSQGDVAGYVLKKMSVKEREAFQNEGLPEALNMVMEMATVMERNARSQYRKNESS